MVDGWTSPILISYLGIVLMWYDRGSIHRTTIEFARYVELAPSFIQSDTFRLDARHTGQYLAEVLFDCLSRYGLVNKVSLPHLLSFSGSELSSDVHHLHG